MNLNNVGQKKKMKKLLSRKIGGGSFCMCFGSVVLENGFVVGQGSKRPQGVEPVVSPPVNMSSEGKDKDVVGSFGRKNKLGRRGFSRYVKAVFFETSLMKKIRKKKSEQKFNWSTYTNVKYSKPISKLKDETSCEEDNHSKRSTSTSTFTTSTRNSSSSTTSTTTTTSRCSSSSLSWNSRPSLSQTVENNLQGKRCQGFNVGVCLLLVSLLVLVIWGKVCAIFCTSTWLFFAYGWSRSTIKLVPPENIADVDQRFPENIDAELYKKKIIMEGLLERNHSRNRFPC